MTLNIAHSQFPEQQGGLFICGYEWGGGDESASSNESAAIDWDASCTFSNKHLRYGPAALKWRYDNRIKKWFRMWNLPINQENPGELDKSIVQTNWCDTQNPAMNGDYSVLREPRQVNNFLSHIAHFSPNLVLFMGSRLIETLQHPSTLSRFQDVVGTCTRPVKALQKPSEHRRFKIWFQTFERCEVVCLPHPLSSRGLSDDYIALFNEEMRERIADYKLARMYDRKVPGCRPLSRHNVWVKASS
ncbi:MAG: hypothetical protein B7X92_14940 [Novosphingobium sp. 17-62-9]|nr:MAG: hypothetical protein B7X92_14940 [Novosphingobium sp. 17-62-9]